MGTLAAEERRHLDRKETLWLWAGCSIYLLLFAGDGLAAYFSGDDLMNLHGHWSTSWRELSVQNLWPFSGDYRPLGGLAYRIVFALFGFDPLPLRILCFSLLLGNLWVACLLFRELASGSRATAIAAVVFSYNAQMADLHYSGGTLYELTAFLLYSSALLTYVRTSAGNRRLSRTALITALFVGALNSKEIAITLPAVLAAYEIVCARDGLRGVRIALRQRSARVISLIATSVVAAAYVPAKLLSDSPQLQVAAYRPELSIDQYLGALGHYVARVTYQAGEPGEAAAAVVLVLAAAAAYLLRSRAQTFGLVFVAIAVLPIAVVAPRAGFAFYIPFFGLSLFAGELLGGALRRFLAVLPQGLARRMNPLSTAILAAALLTPAHASHRAVPREAVMLGVDERRRVGEQLAVQRDALCAADSVFWQLDPFEDYSAFFMTRLLCANPQLVVQHRSTRDDSTGYEAAVLFEGQRLTVSNPTSGSDSSPQPIEVRLRPEIVRPGDAYVIEIPELAGRMIDVAYAGGSGYFSQAGVIEDFCRLNGEGKASVQTPLDQPRGVARITHVREQGGRWRPTEAAIEVRTE